MSQNTCEKCQNAPVSIAGGSSTTAASSRIKWKGMRVKGILSYLGRNIQPKSVVIYSGFIQNIVTNQQDTAIKVFHCFTEGLELPIQDG